MADTLVKKVMVTIQGDDADAAAKIEAIKAKGEELKELNPTLTARIDTAVATAQMQVFRAELKAAGADVPVGADTAPATAKVDELKLRIDILKAQRNDVEIGADATRAELELAVLDAELRELEKPAKVDVDTSGLDKARSSALALGVTLAVIGAGTPLAALAAGLGLVGAGFAAASTVAGGFTGELAALEQSARSGAESVGGFSSALGQTGVSALQDFESAAHDVGDALGHVFVAIAPEIDKADEAVKTIADDFDKWAQAGGGNQVGGFLQKLFGDVNMSEVKSDLEDIGKFIENLAKAEGDMSPVAFTGISGFLDVLGHMNPTEIEMLIGLFTVIKTVGAVSGLVDFGKNLAGQIDNIKSAISGLFTDNEGEAAAAGEETGAAYAGGVEEGAASAGTAGEEVAGELASGSAAAAAAGEETGAAYAGGVEEGAQVWALGPEAAAELAGGAEAAGAAGAETGAAYAEGMAGGAEAVAAVGPEAGAQLADGAAAAEGAGTETGAAFAEGVASGAEAAAAVVPEVTGTLEAAAVGATEAGVMTGEGFAEGLAATGAAVEAEAVEIAEVVDTTLAAALIIASPSQRLRARGQQAGQGFVLGLADTLDAAAGAGGAVAQALVRGVDSQQSAVRTAGQRTAAAAGSSASSGPGGGAQTVTLQFAGNANDALWQLIKKNIRVKGGNVQVVGA